MKDKPHDSAPKQNLATKEHVSQSIYFSSEAFNALRRELYDHWREDPQTQVGRLVDRSLWYYSGLMVTMPAAFVEIMSLELGLPILFDSGREQEICLEILNALRRVRGVSSL